MLLSIIVPVYNTAPWLRRCLDSLIAQTYKQLEILCVNDGSTDDSSKILEEYAAKDSRIRVFTQENAGLSAARNTALEHATGTWVTGVDSDDYLAPDVYTRAMAYANDHVDIVFFGVRETTDSGKLLPLNPYFSLPTEGVYEMTPNLEETINVCFWSKLWRRSVLERNKMRFPHGLIHEDEALFYMYAPFVRKAAFIPDIGYYYVQRGGSIMHSGDNTLADATQYLGVLRYVHQFYLTHGIDPLHGGYFLRQFGHTYHLVERFCPTAQRERLAGMFRKLADETGLSQAHASDQRIRCIQKSHRLARFFIRRRACSTQFRLGIIPLFAVLYKNGKRAGWRFDAWLVLKTICLRFFLRRKKTSKY